MTQVCVFMVTSEASCRLGSWCSCRTCAFGSYAGWLWLSLAWCWTCVTKKKKVSNLKFGSLHFISRGFLKCNSCVRNSQRGVRRWLTWPCQTAPSTSSLFPPFYRRTGSRASLVDGSGRSRTTTEEEEHVSEQQMAGRSVDGNGNGNGRRKRVTI